VFNKVRQAIAWFLDGLAEIVVAVEDRIRRRGRMRVVRRGDGFAAEHADGRGALQPLHLERRGDSVGFAPAQTAAQLKGHDVELVLSADELLVRTLDPLPAESRPYIDGIVRHQLDRLVPWRADDVLYAYQVAPTGAKDERLVVTVAATARSLHAPLIEALRALDPRELWLTCPAVPQMGGEVAIRVNGERAGLVRMQQARRGVAIALASLVALAALGFAFFTYTGRQASEALVTAEQAVSVLRQRLLARGTQTAGARDLNALVERRRSAPFSVLAVEALAEALPDDTWITELRIAEGRMRVVGVSQSVAQLVPLVEASPRFTEASFFAPTTRLPNGQGDRFNLEVRLLPLRSKKP